MWNLKNDANKLIGIFPIKGNFDIATSCLSLKRCKVNGVTNLKIARSFTQQAFSFTSLKTYSTQVLCQTEVTLSCPGVK